MLYGPRTADVTAFIESLPTFTAAEWDEGWKAAVRYQVDLEEALDRAAMEVRFALLDHPVLDEALTAAKSPTLAAIGTLSWPGSSEPGGVRKDVIAALGALVVLDSVDLDAVLVRFRPFRFSSVAIPVQWGASIVD